MVLWRLRVREIAGGSLISFRPHQPFHCSSTSACPIDNFDCRRFAAIHRLLAILYCRASESKKRLEAYDVAKSFSLRDKGIHRSPSNWHSSAPWACRLQLALRGSGFASPGPGLPRQVAVLAVRQPFNGRPSLAA
jgi:hypothetical protein